MKLKLIIALIASLISTIHAGAYDFTKLTNPAKEACNDIACGLAKYPGTAALTTGLTGCVLIHVHHDRKRIIEAEEQEWDQLLKKQYDPDLRNMPDTRTRSAKELARFTKANIEIEREMKQLAAGTITHQNIIDEIQKNKQTIQNPQLNTLIDTCIQEYDTANSPDKEYTLLFTHNYLKQKQHFALEKAHHKLWIDAGTLIALASILGYGAYKAYPQLKKWYAQYVK